MQTSDCHAISRRDLWIYGSGQVFTVSWRSASIKGRKEEARGPPFEQPWPIFCHFPTPSIERIYYFETLTFRDSIDIYYYSRYQYCIPYFNYHNVIFHAVSTFNCPTFARRWIFVNGVPPLHFGEFWWMGSPLCNLVNGVPPLHFGEWSPPFALSWIMVNGVPPLHCREFWWMGFPTLHFGEWGPVFALLDCNLIAIAMQLTKKQYTGHWQH